jgi:PleD family two-component response regulator
MSAGCASSTELAEPTLEALMKTADVRLYAAKNSGRNRVAASP